MKQDSYPSIFNWNWSEFHADQQGPNNLHKHQGKWSIKTKIFTNMLHSTEWLKNYLVASFFITYKPSQWTSTEKQKELLTSEKSYMKWICKKWLTDTLESYELRIPVSLKPTHASWEPGDIGNIPPITFERSATLSTMKSRTWNILINQSWISFQNTLMHWMFRLESS